MRITQVIILGIALVSTSALAATNTKAPARKPQATNPSALAAPAATSQATTEIESTERSFHIRPVFNYSFVSPTAMNNSFSLFAQSAGSTDTMKISGAPAFGIAAEYAVIEQFLLGARMEYFTTSTDTTSLKFGQGNAAVTANFQSTLSGLPVYATATFAQPVAQRWTLGLTGGAGMAIFYRTDMEVTNASPNQTTIQNANERYSANPFTGFGLAFVNFGFTDRVALRVEGGYRYLASNQLKLVENTGNTKAGTVLKEIDSDNDATNNKNLNIDSSALFTGAALTISL